MKDNRYNWKIKDTSDVDIEELATETKINPVLVKILVARGMKSADEILNFINDDPQIIHDPFLLHDMQTAVDRIFKAIENDEKILIYGDYDADGVTSTTIMFETLDQLGANVQYFIPDRFKDGYGPNLEEYQRFIGEGVQVIVTVDNGVAGNVAIDYAQENGVDVIVTDHHELPAELPHAFAIVHPRHPQGDYPFGDLSGVGVAFKVATALLEEIPEEFLDLYAIGTVADLVSMTDENRFLVKAGLNLIPETQRIGLQKLIDISGVDPVHFDEQDIGFTIAPRINAIGRLGDANQAVELLITFDEDRATQLAKKINDVNSERQGLVSAIFDSAVKIAKDQDHAKSQTLVIIGHDWHQGVLGIVASRIVELTNKPTIVLSDQEHNEVYKGSGRSVQKLNLFQAINPVREQFIAFGGHHMAIGITIKGDELVILENQLEKAALENKLNFRDQPEFLIDVKAQISDFSKELVEEIKTIGPFGTNNPIPRFELEEVRVKEAKAIGKDSSHLKFTVADGAETINAIAFKRGEITDILNNISNPISIAGTVNTNEWRGNVSLQFMADDIKIKGLQVIDKRTSNLNKNLFEKDTQYVFFNQKLMQLIKNQDIDRNLYLFDSDDIKKNDAITLVDCPSNFEELSRVIKFNQPQQIVAYFFHQIDFYADGMPSRTEFKQVFALISTQKLSQEAVKKLGSELKINQEKVNFMIKVFFELNFVKIENGLLFVNSDVQQHQLDEAPAYKKREELIKTQEKLLYSNGNELSAILEQLINV